MTNIMNYFGNYLKAETLSGDTPATIKEVKIETLGGEEKAKEKPVVYFEELEKGLALNKVNAESIAEICGTAESDEWTGKQVLLYVDKNVQFAGKRTGGIRIKSIIEQAVVK